MLPEVAIDSVLWECLCMFTKHFDACEPCSKDAGNLGIFMHVDIFPNPVLTMQCTYLFTLFFHFMSPSLLQDSSPLHPQ
jgi:hypothetical protein